MDLNILKEVNVLYVEDEPIVREMISSTLSMVVNNLTLANDGLEGLASFKESKESDDKRIDLIITDINMPHMNGLEMIEKIREIDHLIPIIIVSAHSDNDFLRKAIDLRVTGYAIKPLVIKTLVDTMLQAYESTYLRKNLEKKVDEQTEQIRSILDLQDNIVIMTDKNKIEFANKKLFEFTNLKNLEEFNERYDCICDLFIENDKFFHLGKIDNTEDWIEILYNTPQADKKVSMIGKDFNIYAFSLAINKIDDDSYIISLTDITDTMIENIKLQEKTIHDKLTGAYNREYFEQNYLEFIKGCESKNKSLGLAILDIDHFKSVNDTYGHDIGDEVLKQFVNTILKYSRDDDILIRWGGEEFILMLRVNSLEDLQKALEHMRTVIELQNFPTVGTKTCSIGACIHIKEDDIQQTIKKADDALYEAKKTGRNKVVIR